MSDFTTSILGGPLSLFRQLARKTRENEHLYATAHDLRSIFSDDMESLYHLALLLTGDPQLAEQCFVEGLQDAVSDNRVFKEWARAWAKRAIIERAIRILKPSRPHSRAWNDAPRNDTVYNKSCTPETARSAVFALCDFDRFVFVMTVLERYSTSNTARLLHCSSDDVATARIRALQQFAS